MKKISIYVHDEIEGASEKAMDLLVSCLCQNDVEVVNIKCEEATEEDIDEAIK